MRSVQQVIQNTNTASDDIFNFEREVIKTYVCDGCKNTVQVVKMRLPFGPKKGQVVTHEHGCDCELLAKFYKEREEARKARLRRVFEENSLVNNALKSATLENFEKNEFYAALQTAIRYVENFSLDKPSNLFFQGTFGTGKSHLSYAIAKELNKRGYTTIFISTPKLLTKIRSTYNSESELSEDKIVKAICDVDLVVFDDIGAEGDISGWGMQKLFEVIDGRAGKHNIFTTNLTSKELEATKDLSRIFSRMMMNSEPVIMNGTDYRRKKFKKGGC